MIKFGTEPIVYEQPLSERMRVFLRLEHLFALVQHSLQGEAIWDCRQALSTFMDILTMADRTDIKGETMKELERHAAGLMRLKQTPSLDHIKLNQVLGRIESQSQKLNQMRGRAGQSFRENDFISAIRQRASFPGGTCDFDLPAYHYWLQQPVHMRRTLLREWISEFATISSAISLILDMTRSATEPQEQIAAQGFFQRVLDPNIPCQLIRVVVDEAILAYPEISAGRHRINIRFLTPSANARPIQTSQDVNFQLCCCVI